MQNLQPAENCDLVQTMWALLFIYLFIFLSWQVSAVSSKLGNTF